MIKNIISYIRLKPVLAVGFLLACSSLLFGTWVASIPGIKERLGLTDGSLGLSLLLSPLGALTGVALSTKLFSKISVGKWMLAGYIIVSVIMIAQINAVSVYMLWACLYLFGFFSFLNGVSVNTTINRLEKEYNRKLMSTSHALYSIGGGVSAGLAIAFFGMGIPSGWQIVIVAIVICCILLLSRHHLLAHKEIIHTSSGLRLPSLSILSISFICMVIFMAEGCVADWSGIYLKETMHAPPELVSLGYAGFAIAMTIGRLNGDNLITKAGSKKVVIAGSFLAAAGFSLVVFAPVVIVAIAGYILIGFGCSCIVPVLFSASGNIPGVSPVEGYAMVTTGGLIGFLTGPSLIGFISEKASLATGLSLLILLAVAAAAIGWKNKFLGQSTSLNTELEYDEQIY